MSSLSTDGTLCSTYIHISTLPCCVWGRGMGYMKNRVRRTRVSRTQFMEGWHSFRRMKHNNNRSVRCSHVNSVVHIIIICWSISRKMIGKTFRCIDAVRMVLPTHPRLVRVLQSVLHLGVLPWNVFAYRYIIIVLHCLWYSHIGFRIK